MLPERLNEGTTTKAIVANGKTIFLIPNTPLEWSGGKKGDQTPAPVYSSILSIEAEWP